MVIFVTIMPLSGCLSFEDDAELLIAATTSLRDSGLLDYVIEDFEKTHNFSIDYVALGTGAALNLGKNQDVDALIVHAPELEIAFINDGYGFNRTLLAWNYFVLLAPADTPPTLQASFLSIYENQSCFISRGDNSGTHHKEQLIWETLAKERDISLIEDENGLHPSGDWYISSGTGMGATITMADQLGCFTLSDRGTALNFASSVELEIVEFKDELIYNPYSFIFVSEKPTTYSEIFLEYLLNDGKALIGNYSIAGEKAFKVSQS